ncbi:MAG: 3-deoxy-D-manno-octulosonic acid transferase [Acidobacteria bacterium]|nr:3-deoxy-D-manno-octulosonic acid transferase [Acidobacteriota bacterium]
MYFIYQLILLLASPLFAVWMLVRVLAGRMPGIGQRLGFFPKPPRPKTGPRLWLHAVSLGEVKVATGLAAELRERVADLPNLSNLEVIFTTSTKTGQQEALRAAGPRDVVLFPPLDFAWVCRRFLKYIQADALLIVETELWPNLFRQARRACLPLRIVNGRISDRSWPRYRSTLWFWRNVLDNVDHVYASGQADAERFLALVVSLEKLTTAENLKFRIHRGRTQSGEFVRKAAAQLLGSPETKVLVAGSTMPGEELLLIDAYRVLRQEFPDLWLILAPRHPERFGEVAALLANARIPVTRRSAWQADQSIQMTGALLLDTIGELASVYQLATVAFVGGTLVNAGGHNILEPAMFGKPIVIGPSMENFSEIADRFLRDATQLQIPLATEVAVGGIIQIRDAGSLAPVIRYLLASPIAAELIGNLARQVLERSQESYSSVLEDIVSLLGKTHSKAK